MQQKTSSLEFDKYGKVYSTPIDLSQMQYTSRDWHVLNNSAIIQMYYFSCEVYLEMQTGMANLLISTTPDNESLELFSIHRYVKIKPYMYFSLSAVTPNITYKLIYPVGQEATMVSLPTPYIPNRIVPRIRINEILGCYYNARISGYNFTGEQHNYFELTFVDRGSLITSINNKHFDLKEREMIFYGPGQFHNQHIEEGNSCSYVTIIFDMVFMNYNMENTHYEALLNRVFPYDKKIYSLMKDFVQESSIESPYSNSLMLSILQEIILRLLQGDDSQNKKEKPVNNVRQHYQDELLEKILTYVDDSIYEPITIAEICQKFSMSRSSLQILFKANLDQTPKKYINDLKLEKSKQLIQESKYTISEISLMLGFNSIHYFSRAFTAKYGMAPSEYSKQIYSLK